MADSFDDMMLEIKLPAGGISFSYTLQTSHEMALLHEHNIQL